MAASMSEQNKNEIELVRNFDLNLIDKEFITNPFPTCRALRNHSPLHQNADGSLFLTRYDDVMTAYRHPAMSSDKKVAFKKNLAKAPFTLITQPALSSMILRTTLLSGSFYHLASHRENFGAWSLLSKKLLMAYWTDWAT